jgi:hypothetical protein
MAELETREKVTRPVHWFPALGFLCVLLFTGPLCHAAKLVPALGWDVNKQGGFPVSLAADPAGNIWVGTEGSGVWKYDAGAKTWTQFTVKDGLGDDSVYALAFDRQHRLWAGHLNHGVSVYNGSTWRNYGLVDGPLGDRVFSIAVSPKDGDVWIATDMGLARYSEKRQDWDYYTRASGLPSDQIQCIAFDDNGQLYAGTQCAGIAIASPADNFTRWHPVTARPPLPAAPDGDGLASDLINNILAFQVEGEDLPTVVAATPSGATVETGGKWAFIHGKDWQEHTPGPYLAGSLPGAPVPAEDWLTVLQLEGTRVWAGYRKEGVESADLSAPATPVVQGNVDKPGSVFIRAILAQPDQPPLFAAYDAAAGGLMTLDDAPPLKPIATGSAAIPNLPAPAPVPALGEAAALSAPLAKLNKEIATGEAFFLADDWRTEGDWVGRYGSGYVKLCGIGQNGDQNYELAPGYDVSLSVGPHHEATAAGPVWYHANDSTGDPRIPYDPTLGHRREAEENDFSYDSKTYPESYDGPDLWVRVKVPDGVQCLSLYFVNDDAHAEGLNKYRDYDVQVLSDDPDINKIQTGKPLARTRVTDFWGGVYKQFLIRGPASYVVRIGRDRSFVTKLQGVFLDPVYQPDNLGTLPGFDTATYTMPDEPDNYQPTPLTNAAVNLWSQLDDALALRGAIFAQIPFRIWCYRAAIAGQAPAEILERWRWQIGIWTPEDRKKFDDAMKAAHDAAK